MASIHFTEEGRETLHKLHIENQRRIKRALKKIEEKPAVGKALVGRLTGFYSVRAGKYRVVYSLEDESVIVHHVGHRRDVYDVEVLEVAGSYIRELN